MLVLIVIAAAYLYKSSKNDEIDKINAEVKKEEPIPEKIPDVVVIPKDKIVIAAEVKKVPDKIIVKQLKSPEILPDQVATPGYSSIWN